MLNWLSGWYIDRLIAKERESLPPIDWRALTRTLGEAIEDGRVFLETRNQRFVPMGSLGSDSEGLDIVSLVVTWSHEGVRPWETEQALVERLSERSDVSAVLLLNRCVDSFVGYYVRIRHRQP